jgi:hypothetical protein
MVRYLSQAEINALPTAERAAYMKEFNAMIKAVRGDVDNRFGTWQGKNEDGTPKGKKYLTIKFKSGGKANLYSKANIEEMIADAQAILNAANELGVD